MVHDPAARQSWDNSGHLRRSDGNVEGSVGEGSSEDAAGGEGPDACERKRRVRTTRRSGSGCGEWAAVTRQVGAGESWWGVDGLIGGQECGAGAPDGRSACFEKPATVLIPLQEWSAPECHKETSSLPRSSGAIPVWCKQMGFWCADQPPGNVNGPQSAGDPKVCRHRWNRCALPAESGQTWRFAHHDLEFAF